MQTITSTGMSVDRFVLNTFSQGEFLKATMKRYRPSSVDRRPQDPGYILIFMHGIGFHKETWEPTIEHLFENDDGNTDPARVLECWAIDSQSHGEASILNDEVLSTKQDMLTIHPYADALVELYQSGLLGKLQKSDHKIVLVGHSAAAVGVVFSIVRFSSSETLPFHSAILVDPALYTSAMVDRMTDMLRAVKKSTPIRRSVWPSKEDAHEWLKARIPWNVWDPRALKLYSEYGLRPLPTGSHPNEKGVILCCSPAQEVSSFNGISDAIKATEHLSELCSLIPVHLVFGTKNDLFSREVKDSLHDPSAGRVMASITRVEGVGHLIPQEKPKGMADALYAILMKDYVRLKSQTPKL